MNYQKVVFTMLLTAVFASCTNYDRSDKLKEIIRAEEILPSYDLMLYDHLDKVEYRGTEVIITSIVNQNTVYIDAFNSFEATYREYILTYFSKPLNKAFKEVLDAIIDNKANLNMVFISKKTGKKCTMRFTSDELRLNRLYNAEDNEKLLIIGTADCKNNLPQELSKGLVISDVILSDKYFTYVYSCDESIYDIEILRANTNTIKKDNIQNVNYVQEQDRDFLIFVNRLKITNRGIAYKYVGTTTGKSVIVFIEPEEL